MFTVLMALEFLAQNFVFQDFTAPLPQVCSLEVDCVYILILKGDRGAAFCGSADGD